MKNLKFMHFDGNVLKKSFHPQEMQMKLPTTLLGTIENILW